MDVRQKCIEAYERHKHLGLAAQEVGIPWQTVYVHLRNADVSVTGDKARYGSDSDRLATRGEEYFKSFVPFAEDQNKKQFQPKFDFLVNGHKVDVKSSSQRKSNKAAKTLRWAFYSKKQESTADFFVLIGFTKDDPTHVWLIPGEISRKYTTISISQSASGGKWWDYAINPNHLADFFKAINPIESKL